MTISSIWCFSMISGGLNASLMSHGIGAPPTAVSLQRVADQNQRFLTLLELELSYQPIDELELGLRLLRSPVVAVTGTNGKSTTAALVQAALEAGGAASAITGSRSPFSSRAASATSRTTRAKCSSVRIPTSGTPAHTLVAAPDT